MTYALRVFFIGGLMSYRALFGWMSPWVFIPTLLVAPIFQILLFVFIGRAAEIESDSFYVVGNALQYASVPCVAAMTQTIAGERMQRTLGYILISPAGRIPLFVGRTLTQPRSTVLHAGPRVSRFPSSIRSASTEIL